MPIKLSIITAVYNRVDMIEKAVECVREQWVDGMEHIIIDGGSTDGTIEILQKYPHLRVRSGPDNGIYDAWNKGVRLAEGEFITFFNSDDLYFDGALHRVFQALQESNGILIANASVFNLTESAQLSFQKTYPAMPAGNLLDALTNRPPAINAWIISKTTFKNIGNFDTTFSIAADVDFCVRAILQEKKITPVDIDFYKYIAHPNSLTLNQTRLSKYNYQHQNCDVAVKLLREGIDDSSAERAVKRWLNITCYNLFVSSIILKKGLKTSLRIMHTGFKNNYLFPFSFIIYSINYWITRIMHVNKHTRKHINHG